MVEEQKLKPTQELLTVDNYRWFTYSADQTGLMLVCLEDLSTGVITTTTISDPEKRTAAHRAWAGARHSRAAGTPWEIMHEMGEKGVDPDQKLEEMFKNYGHASVGDMARLEVDIVNVPMHFPLATFNLGYINSGQEKSTRFQSSFGSLSTLHSIRNYLPVDDLPEQEVAKLEETYQKFGSLSLELFAKHRERLTTAFSEFYKPEDNSQRSALSSRVLDCVRYFLLLGQSSGFSFETSARDWSRIISELKASPIAFYGNVASQVEMLLAPSLEEEKRLGFKAEAPGLIRHTEAATTTNENLLALKKLVLASADGDENDFPKDFLGQVKQDVRLLLSQEYSDGVKMAAQYLITLWPAFSNHRTDLLNWLVGLKSQEHSNTVNVISKTIFNGHTNYDELPVSLASTRGTTLIFESFLGEVRDFNRHRAWGRFIDLPLVFGLKWNPSLVEQVISKGFGLPLYLSEVEEFSTLGTEFSDDLQNYYDQLYQFLDTFKSSLGESGDYSAFVNLLPLAHRTDIWMHGDPKQALYFTDRRVRPGGHINYRELAYQANRLIAGSDPFLSALAFNKRPDPASREEFFDRS